MRKIKKTNWYKLILDTGFIEILPSTVIINGWYCPNRKTKTYSISFGWLIFQIQLGQIVGD